MRHILRLSLSALTLLPITATAFQPILKPTCAAETDIADFYRTDDVQPNRRYYGTESEVQIRGNRLLFNPKDDEAFVSFCQPQLPYSEILLPENRESIPEGGMEALMAALYYKNLLVRVNSTGQKIGGNHRPQFLLAIRDLLTSTSDIEGISTGLMRLIAEDADLTEDELGIADAMLKNWCHVSKCHLVESRQVQFILQKYRGGKPVCFDTATDKQITNRYPGLIPLLHAERALNGQAALCVNRAKQWHRHLLHHLLWQHTEGAVQLAHKLRMPAYELLYCKSESIPEFLKHRGITYYRLLGQETPQSCQTALAVRDFESPAAAAATVKRQNSALPRELKALAPRCILALGGGQADWQPVKLSPEGVHPSWPDASAVTLPMWGPHLLGLPDEQAKTVQTAFASDLEALEKLLTALRREHGAAGCVLADMLRTCDRVRPVHRDLVIPVYARIALHFEADGLSIDYSPRDASFEIHAENASTGLPIVDEALNKAPQLLHRLTLQLALLEKHGHTQELEQACSRMARVLNRSNLWPLIICQRELRGFSPQALLTLFTHYEGEREPLATYAEAMGMSAEMNVAVHAHEDELGESLTHAARISGALAGTGEEQQQAADALLDMARTRPETAADIVRLLLTHGHTEQVLQWDELPAAALRGRHAGNGLLLIRHHLRSGNRTAAQQVRELMAQDAATDTTAAYRYACSLLSDNAEEKERLRRDALLLAMFSYHIDHREYEAWRNALAREGEEIELLMKAELTLSGGRSVGITPALAQYYATAGQWATAAFCYEYLIAEGISTATPYAQVPDHAAICRYRQQANDCHSRARQRQKSDSE